ncbi:unnamed protein product [Durusdinium trenchii]|uniref:Uncharacterized protein n=2 Tax=Durusdinium trenchii TaxID=1381693 RepID=A0ABP0P2M4_9DINO
MRILPVFLLLCLSPVDGRVKGLFSKYTKVLPEKECTCNCCIREQRRPSEISDSKKSFYKCALAPASDNQYVQNKCSDSCTVVNDPIFPRASTISANRFCFYHCVPTSGGSSSPQQAAAKNQDVEALLNGGSLLDAPCISVPEDRLEEAMSPDGNGRDAQLEA